MPENEEQGTKVVTNLNAGLAKPIPVSASDAVQVAHDQTVYHETVSPLDANQQNINQTPNNQNNVVTPTLVGNNQNFVDVNQVNQVNDLVKVVDVKYSKKTVFILLGVIVVIVLIIIFELVTILGD